MIGRINPYIPFKGMIITKDGGVNTDDIVAFKFNPSNGHVTMSNTVSVYLRDRQEPIVLSVEQGKIQDKFVVAYSMAAKSPAEIEHV